MKIHQSEFEPGHCRSFAKIVTVYFISSQCYPQKMRVKLWPKTPKYDNLKFEFSPKSRMVFLMKSQKKKQV